MIDKNSIIILFSVSFVLTKVYFFVNIFLFLARYQSEKEISYCIFNDFYVICIAICL